MQEIREKPDDLAARILGAENHKTAATDQSAARRMGGDFVGAVAGGGIVGALLDRFFLTGPWWLLAGVFLGFCCGMLAVWRSMKQEGDVRKG